MVEFRGVKESRPWKADYINYMQINPHVVQGSTLPSITRDYYEQLYANKMDNLENGWIPRNIQLTKAKSGIKRKYE